MLKLKPYSSTLLSFGGFLLMAMGLYFIFIRPSLLPEDLRYMNITLLTLESKIPNLQPWLQKVFWVIGGYIFAIENRSGIRCCYIHFLFIPIY